MIFFSSISYAAFWERDGVPCCLNYIPRCFEVNRSINAIRQLELVTISKECFQGNRLHFVIAHAPKNASRLILCASRTFVPILMRMSIFQPSAYFHKVPHKVIKGFLNHVRHPNPSYLLTLASILWTITDNAFAIFRIFARCHSQ